MKKYIFFELMRNIKSKPELMRKMKVFAAVGAFGFLLMGSLIIWAGISAVSYFTRVTKEVIQSPQTVLHVENIKSEVKGVSTIIQSVDCWDKAQSLMTLEPWLQKPAMDNLNSLIKTCLENADKQIKNTAKGGPHDSYHVQKFR